MDSPLQMRIDAAVPTKASVSMGDIGEGGTWDADVSVDEAGHTVAIAAGGGMGDAALLAGKLEGDVLSGEMEKQLCNRFTLTRQP